MEEQQPKPPPGASPRSGKPPPVHTRWKKGQSGNPKGRPKGAGLTDAVRRVLSQEHNGRPVVEVLAEIVVRHALAGKYTFAKEIWDRIDGRVQDKLEVESKGAQPVVLTILAPKVIGETDGQPGARPERELARLPPPLPSVPLPPPSSVLGA